MYTIRFQKKVISAALLSLGIFIAGLILHQSLYIPTVFAQGEDTSSDTGSGTGSSTDTDSSGCGNDLGSAGGGSHGGSAQDGGSGDTPITPITGIPRIGILIGAVTCAGVGVNTVAVTVSPQSTVTEFRVDVVTDLNNPEGSVVGTKRNIPAEGGTYSISFPASSGTNYYAVEYAYRDGWWVYSDVSSAFVGIPCAPEIPDTPVTWTPYCTGGSDPNGNNWQWWEKSDANPIEYRFLRAGDGTCQPPAVNGITGTISISPPGPCIVAPNETTCRATISWSTQGAAQSVAQGAGPLWPAGANIDGPTTNSSGSVVKDLPVGDYGFSVSGYDGSSWGTPLHSITYKVVAGKPDLTVSGINPTSAIAGVPTTYSATVTNTGNASTGIGFKNFYQIKTGTVGVGSGNIFTKIINIAHAAEVITDLPYTNMNALGAGASDQARQTYTFPDAGVYAIRVCADKANRNDATGVIPESNEDNNCGGWTQINVTGQCNPACGGGTACFNGSCVTNCPAGYTGTPPNCSVSSSCPSGYSGTPPNCVVQVCTPSTSCTSGANVCGMRNTGTCNTNGSACSVSTPSDSLCPVLALDAVPIRVRKDSATKLTWSATGSIVSCSLRGQNGFSSADLSGTNVDSGAIDAETIFTLSCDTAIGPRSKSVTVTLVPIYIEQ